jgi:hypothetical protein
MTGLRHETIAVIWYATVMLRVMIASPKKFAVAIDKTSAELSWALARICQSRHMGHVACATLITHGYRSNMGNSSSANKISAQDK